MENFTLTLFRSNNLSLTSQSMPQKLEESKLDWNRQTMKLLRTFKPCSRFTERNHFQARHRVARFVTFPFDLREKKRKKQSRHPHSWMFFPTICCIVYCHVVVWSTCELFLLVLAGWKYFSFSKAVINRVWKENPFIKTSTQERPQWQVTS